MNGAGAETASRRATCLVARIRSLILACGSIKEFRRFVRTRGTAFLPAHAVTLGYAGATQIAQGGVEEACETWISGLDAMEDGIYFGRVRQRALEMRKLLSPYRERGIPAVAVLEIFKGVGYVGS